MKNKSRSSEGQQAQKAFGESEKVREQQEKAV